MMSVKSSCSSSSSSSSSCEATNGDGVTGSGGGANLEETNGLEKQNSLSEQSGADITALNTSTNGEDKNEHVNGDNVNGTSASIIPIPNDELDLLIKLERANKEMENNHRSAQSILLSNSTTGNTNSNGSSNAINGNNTNNNCSPPSHSLSRRASFTSCEVNSLNNEDSISRMDEISWELWNQIIHEWTTWSKKKPNQLKECIRKGIPLYLRPLAWQYLCGANNTDAKEKYKEYIKKQSACEKIIRRDVDRTYPDTDFFRNPAGQESLFNVMKAYSIHDPEVGYCQGSAFICGLLLIQNIPEEEAFSIFVQIMQHYNLREIYKPNMYHLGLCMFQLECLLQEFLPDLHRHFVAHAFHSSMYSSSWFLTLFTTSLPLPLVCRIFDIFLNEGFEIVFRVGLALLDYHKDNLITLDMEGMLKYFQKELPSKHETDHDGILNKAFAIKYNQRRMKKLEKDFSILKKEEQEEQVEMRRLRAENKLLKQRIDNLEKAFISLTNESAQLAERLIKGQVVNAQNAESIYVLKNENQKLKDKISELQLECEQSNELRKKQLNEQCISSSEREALNERVTMLLEENNKLRENPDISRLEEELVQVKMRDAEAQLAIKELQKTIHVLNLEYQEFLNNRNAYISSLSNNPIVVQNGNESASGASNKQTATNLNASNSVARSDYQALEEELLKIKLREAEANAEMKLMNSKLMQLDTEKQVAYNQIKRQDDEIRKLNVQISQMAEKELENKSQIFEFRRQIDDKEAQLKELNMTHKLQEAEDAHLIAELRQRVASLEVQIQELVTTGQLNDNDKTFNIYNLMSSTDKLSEVANDDMRYLLMASSTSINNRPSSVSTAPCSTGATATQLDRRSSFKNYTTIPVNNLMFNNGAAKTNNSLSLSSIPASLNEPNNIKPVSPGPVNGLDESTKLHLNRSNSVDNGEIHKTSKMRLNQAAVAAATSPNYVITEYVDSDNEESFGELDKSTNSTNALKTQFKTADIDLTLRPPVVENLGHNNDFEKSNDDVEISA